MIVSNKYILVKKYEEPEKEGFKTVEVQDNFVYKGVIERLPEIPVYIGNNHLNVGDIVLFAKYSPDTHEIELDGTKFKFVAINDLLAVYLKK